MLVKWLSGTGTMDLSFLVSIVDSVISNMTVQIIPMTIVGYANDSSW